jgi:mRNA-decapping enzyme subunit 2
MDTSCSKLLLCRTWDGKSWTLPSGKKNQNEDGIKAAVRETYEETGFDVAGEHGDSVGMARGWNELSEEDSISFMEGKKRRTVYICKGVPLDFPFEPVARKEVSEIQFFDVNDLPKKTFNVLPYMKGLRRWMKVSGFGGGGKRGKKGASDRGNSSNQKQRTASSKKDRNNSTKKERNASNKKAREQDNEAFGSNASNSAGWSEEDMLRANEVLNNQKISYSGNPHEFSNDGFDPHKFHVVGGGFMNGPGTDVKTASNIMVTTGAATGGKKIVDEDGFVSFFGDDGAAPWDGEGEEGEGETSNENKDDGKKKKNKNKKKKQNPQQLQQQSPQVVKEQQQKLLTAQDKKNTLMSMIGIGAPTPTQGNDESKSSSKLAEPNSNLIGATVKGETMDMV